MYKLLMKLSSLGNVI